MLVDHVKEQFSWSHPVLEMATRLGMNVIRWSYPLNMLYEVLGW